jgi:sulfatase maturation enzyme AslB (radical SAM superfamily)
MGSSLVAAELFSAGFCNMDCAYCYIHKNKAMKKINDKIVEKIKDGRYIQELKQIYGENLTHLSLWGTEPTINMIDITESMVDDLLKEFPKLENFMFSTNLLDNTEKIITFVSKLNKCTERNLKLDIQFSIDGPEWIVDRNRKPGYAKTIVEGYKEIVREIGKLNLRSNFKIEAHFKPTVSIENIVEISNRNGMVEWFDYFDELFDYFLNTVITNKHNFVMRLAATPTLVVPGEYTKKDGKIYRDFCVELFNLSKKGVSKYQKASLNNYTYRLSRIIRYQSELGTKPNMFTCSAGDSQLGINVDGSFGMCHRTFYTVEDKYLELCKDFADFDYAVESYIGNKYTAKIVDQEQSDRLYYIQRNYHDFLDLKLGYSDAIIRELVKAHQIDEDFEDPGLRLLLALFINTAMSCPGDNLSSVGVSYFPSSSLFRIWGNGAFQVLLNDYVFWNIKY